MNQFKLPKHPVLLRYSSSDEDTLGLLFIGGNGGFQHYILEDEYRDIKVKGETRIPAGVYKLGLRTEGGFHGRYKRKFGDMHKGMIQILGVPNFTFILYHVINDDDDTMGCIGGGDTVNNNQVGPGFTGSSTNAYKRTYPRFLEYMKSTNNPIIEIIDLDR